MSEKEEDFPAKSKTWIPDESFYSSNERSQRIREVSLAITNKLHRLLYDPSTANDPEKQRQVYAELEKHNGDLIELGVKPGMHVGKAVEAFKSNPETAAEFLAGQLIGLTGRRIPTETSAIRTAEEFGVREGNLPVMAKAGEIPTRTTDFMIVKDTVEIVHRLFAAPKQSPAPEK